MAPNGSSSTREPHEEFVELCALATTGDLSEYEEWRLTEHLKICSKCRHTLGEFDAVANIGAPLLVSELDISAAQDEIPVATPIEARRVAGVKADLKQAAFQRSESGEQKTEGLLTNRNGKPGAADWKHVWLSLAAAVLLIVALSLYSYQAGKSRSPAIAQASIPSGGQAKVDNLEQQLSDAGHERVLLTAQLAAKDQQIADLQREIQKEASALSAAKAKQANLAQSLQNAQNQDEQMARQQAAASQSLAAEQGSLGKIQAELDSVRQQRSQDELRAATLETRISGLETALTANQQTANKQQDLLSQDADIRDLMGARDLYIAEVYDVGHDGATEKPYGRIFYTKGKSLIFYAYDLDRQPGARPASAFQAWGQNGPDHQQALNLGVFFEDSVAKKRWVLKFDNARALEQINAVFVTVEPNGGSQTPSGKPLLFASLKIEHNHP